MIDITSTPTLVGSFDYRPYGEVARSWGTVTTGYTYAGLFAQTNTGLLVSTTRAYNPANGKWLSSDPIKEAGGINLTGYVNGSPMMGIDPLGLVTLPTNPEGLPPGWEQDPQHRDPNSSKWRNPAGGCLEFAPGQPGRPGWAGKPHWHDCSDPKDKKRRDKHWKPGEVCPQPGDDEQKQPAVDPVPEPEAGTPQFTPIPGTNPPQGGWWEKLPPPMILPLPPGRGGGGGGWRPWNPDGLIPIT